MGFEQLVALKAKLNQGAKNQTDASRCASSPAGEGRGKKGAPKRMRTSADAAAQAIIVLQRHFPLAFPANSAPKVPLNVGILKDVLAQVATLGLSKRDARNTLKRWCRGQRYWTCLVEGTKRVNLSGTGDGVVSAVEAEYGANQEQIRLERRRQQIEKNRQR